jgi:integrase
MAENPFMKRPPSGPDGKPKRFESNDEIFTAYLLHVKKVNATAAYAGAFYQVRKFLHYWEGTLILEVTRADLLAYVNVYEKACTSFRRGGLPRPGKDPLPNRCAKGLPLDCATCPSYEGMKAATTDQHLSRVAGLFSWLTDNDQLEHNDWEVVVRRWREHNRRRLKKEVSARRLRKRFLTQEEVVQFIEQCPNWTWRILFLLGVKYFLRASEVARLKATPKYLDPELNWIIVPLATGNDGKRIIEVPYPIDAETRKYLRAYLRWRNARLWQKGQTPHDVEELVLTRTGHPFTVDDDVGDRLTDGLRREAKRAAIPDPESIRSHCMRYFATDRAQANGIHGNELKLLRGDWLEAEATGAYIDTKRLHELYAKGCPPLGLREPIL